MLALFLAFGVAQAQDDEAEMMKQWQAAMTPNENHAWLADFEGEWTYVNKAWMDPSSNEPQVSEGKSTKKMVMGGRFLTEDHTGTSFEMPFEGHNTTAYDNVTKMFRTHWYDNFGTGFMIGEGQKDGNVLDIKAEYPNLDGKNTDRFRMVTEVVNKNKHVFTMYDYSTGEERRFMEITYTRKK